MLWLTRTLLRRPVAMPHQRRLLSSTYPTNIKPSTTMKAFVENMQHIPAGARCDDEEDITLCGRITSFRVARNFFFYHIKSGEHAVQVLADKKHFEAGDDEFRRLHTEGLTRGDIVAVRGFPGKTKKGELSLVPRQVTVLSPCLQPIPSGRGDGKDALKDKALRYQNRHVDLLANPFVREIFLKRTALVRAVRNFFEQREFLEVETPVLNSSAGGANATPFTTKLNCENLPLELRIAPELYLKKLVVGGFDRVFEIGKVFRNEGVSARHNPEFTICEAYQAYADYNDMMDMTQNLLKFVAESVNDGSAKANVYTKAGEPVVVDFGAPFQRVPVVAGLESALGLAPGEFPDLASPGVLPQLVELCTTHKVSCELEHKSSVPKLLDRMIGVLLEPTFIQPTFLCNHPVCMSPLAKENPEQPGLTERFELFVAGQEICNSYTELNDPVEQRKRFRAQADLRAGGDAEAHPMNDEFCDALEYGLPPTAGWGIGIDRLAMMLTGQKSIREVILFPTCY